MADQLWLMTRIREEEEDWKLHLTVDEQGRSDGGYISVYTPPKSVTVLFTCGTLTRFEIAMTS